MTEETDHDRELFRHDPIGHARIHPGMTVGELVGEYGKAGIGATAVHEAARLTTAMFRDDVTVLFGLAGPMVPGGMRRIVSDLIRDGYIDALVTTGATLTHDTIEAIGGKHHHGDAPPDTNERAHDETLRAEGVDRIFNVYLPQEHFAGFEQHLRSEVFPHTSGKLGVHEFIALLGEANQRVNESASIEEDAGIAAAAAATDTPIYCPAMEDSILGLQAWMYGQLNDFGIDPLADMSHLNELTNAADEAGAFVVGGGVPKNFVLQAMLVTPDAYDYGVQLTMDRPETGGLTGATLNEARSWGKIAPGGENVSVIGDATITFPLVIGAAREWIE